MTTGETPDRPDPDEETTTVAAVVVAPSPVSPDPAPNFSERVVQAIHEGGDWGGLLMAEVARVLPEGGDWCGSVKAQTLAALVVGLRPRVVCEIGVWTGGSMIPMLLALRVVQELEIARGAATPRRGVAIDAWSADASCADQGSADSAWWGAQSHEDARLAFLARLERLDLTRLCDVVHARSDQVSVPEQIGLLHLDGNHGEQTLRDVGRFAPAVEVGGVLVLDDLQWSGGHVGRALALALRSGFRELYPLGTGVVLRRVERAP